MSFIVLFLLYIIASVASQFLTSTPIELFSIAGVSVWLPLSAISIVPLVDVLRCFTQHEAERIDLSFKITASLMLGFSMVTSALCVLFAGLPAPIFVGVLLAVTIGGALDIVVFRHMGKYFKNPVARMVFSNLAATLTGSGIVFLVAFTDLVFPHNALAKPLFEVLIGWLTQSAFIWVSGIVIAGVIQKVKGIKYA